MAQTVALDRIRKSIERSRFLRRRSPARTVTFVGSPLVQRQGSDIFGGRLVQAVVIGMGLLAGGCSQKGTVDAAIARAAREAAQSRQDTARFAGRVTVDGLAPPANTLVV